MSNLIEWYKTFLDKRDLNKPDGRPLYAYLTSKNEFDKFEITFYNWLKRQLQHKSLNRLVETDVHFNFFFVLYAAEWWKRKYKGGNWSWTPILQDLALNPDDWTAPKRSKCIEKGFDTWQISLKSNLGLRYLGSVALHGGLPMRLLAENNTSIGFVLQRTVNLIEGKVVYKGLIISWIESLKEYLPKTYQKNEIYHLLANVIQTILEFKNSVGSDKPSEIIEAWERDEKKWINELPLDAGQSNIKNLLKRLVRDVASTSVKQEKIEIEFNRTLLLNRQENRSELRGEVIFPVSITVEELRNFFNIPSAVNLDQRMTIVTEIGDYSVDVPIRKVAGQEKIRFEKKAITSPQLVCDGACELRLRTKKGQQWSNKIRNGEPLQIDLPWIFVSEGDSEENSFRFHGQGSHKISNDEAFVIIPENCTIPNNELFGRQVLAELNGRKIIHLKDQIELKADDGEDYRIRTGQARGLENTYWLIGDRVRDFFKTNRDVFRGIPELRNKNDSGYQEDKVLIWKWAKGNEKKVFNKIYGPVTVKVQSGIYTDWKKSIIVLPINSSECLIHGRSPQEGKWKFYNWNLAELNSKNPKVQISKKGTDEFRFLYLGKGRPPESVLVKALWPRNPNSATLELKFPGKGCRIFDATGEEISNDSRIGIGEIYGTRLFAALGNKQMAQLHLELVDQKTNQSNLYNLDTNSNLGQVDLRLIDYKSDIEFLLSASDHLDKSVRITFKAEGIRRTSIYVARYSVFPEIKGNKWLYIPKNQLERINLHQNSNADLLAQRLDVPGVASINLVVTESGLIEIPEEKMSPGPWYIYVDENSDYAIRPRIITIKGEVEKNSGLAKCSYIKDTKERKEFIDFCLERITDNPDHDDWDYVIKLANEFGHLDLSVLDIWRRITLNSRAMALLAEKVNELPNGFLSRFSNELPFMWELVTVPDWMYVIDYIQDSIPNSLNKFKSDLLKSKNEEIISIDESLEINLRIAYFNKVGTIDNQLVRTEQGLIDKLFEDKQSSYQRLRRRHIRKNETWPNTDELFSIIKAIKKHTTDTVFEFEDNYRDVVINAPIALACFNYFGSLEFDFCFNKKSVLTLKEIKQFDPDWFIDAFNTTLKRLLIINKS